MALNLSTLTSPATSGDVLAEALTTADFLEPVPVLRNLSRGSNKGGDAKQDVALNQPKALPLVNGSGYVYLPNITGNAPAVTFPNVPSSTNFVLTIVADVRNPTSFHFATGASSAHRFLIHANRFYALGTNVSLSSAITSGHSTFVIERTGGSTITLKQNGVTKATMTLTNGFDMTHISFNGQYTTSAQPTLGYFKSVVLTIGGTESLNVDFTATNVRHGDTKFKCATGQVVTINQSGNDPATIIKKPVLRFDGANDFMKGVFGQTIDGGYMFAAFSVLGNGGNPSGRVFSINSTGIADSGSRSAIFSHTEGTKTDLQSFYNGQPLNIQNNLFDDSNGDILHESLIKNGSQKAGVNNANFLNTSLSTSIESEEFNISCNPTAVDARNTAIDLEYLALFDATITDAQADSVRNYINNRNNVFSLIDSQGFYFFDPQKATFTGNFTAANTLDGYITGSDLGDTDVRTNLTLEQSTLNDQPSTDGYTITFNDSAEHLEFENSASQNLSGWQVVGTSLGTFAYRVDNDAVTELNLLGNLGSTSYRQAGDLYGIILLPESATGADIEAARKLLIDRGAADGTTASNYTGAWRQRGDITEFRDVDFTGVNNAAHAWRETEITSFNIELPDATSVTAAWRETELTSFATELPDATSVNNAWYQCRSLASFNVNELPSAINVSNAWLGCNSLSDFRTTEIPNGTNFTSAWQGTSALTSFPSGAKLGTAASNVNFTDAWRSSGLTSFPADINLSQGTNFFNTWRGTDLTSFETPITSATRLPQAWQSCGSLTNFSSAVLQNWNPSSLVTGVFNRTWLFCTSLTAQSVENILTSIDASGQYATSTGASGGTALGDAGIDIDYNVATGSLSAATNSAIDSLSGKGWEVFINGVLVIPNILDLAPAAAYSLRSFDSDADPVVVNVRRSSDSASSNFKASEVSDGTLTSWVNTEYDLVTPTLNNGGFEGGLTGWSTGGAVLDTSVAYAGNNSARFDIVAGGYKELTKPVLEIGKQYKVTFYAKISDSSKTTRVDFGSGNLNPVNFSSTDWEYKEVTGVASGSTSFRFARDGASGGDYTVNFDNITVTQLTADGHVTTWYDQSGNNNSSNQTLASSQPKIVSGGTLVTDGSGNPAIVGDGVDDTLFHPTLTQSLDNTDFLVTAAYKNSLALGVSGGVPRLYMTQGAWSYNNLSSITFSNQSGRNVLSFQTNGNAQQVFGNGISLGTSSEAQANFSQTSFNLMRAGSGFSNGFLMEVVVFDENQVSNRTGIEANIMDTYSIS
jgi:hypothetical protein